MGKYVENNLGKGETIVKKAELNPAALVGAWIFGILFCWLLLIPLFCFVSIVISSDAKRSREISF